MSWNTLEAADQLSHIQQQSHQKPQLIFKHSTRCSVSSMALSRLERAGFQPHIDFHLLDLIAHRPLSNLVAETFDVWHESPQVLLIKNGECVYDESHMGIQMHEIVAQAAR
jgi:bacillithiol system protein YtxJ